MAILKSEIQLRGLRAVSNGALAADTLPSRLKILDWGTSESIQGPVTLDERSAQVFAAAQKQIGREKVALDWEHNTVPGTDAYREQPEPKSVAAYGVPRIIPNEGLFLEQLEWTPDGEKNAKNYADLSPAPFLVDGCLIAIHSAALTRAGAVADLSFYSTGGMDREISALTKLSLPLPKLPDDFPPLETKENVISALAYINQPRNFKALSAATFPVVKAALEQAISKHKIPTTLNSISDLPAYASAAPFIDPIKRTGDHCMSEHIAAIKKHLGMHEDTPDEEVMKHVAEHMKKNPHSMGKTGPLDKVAPGATTDNYGLSHEQYTSMAASFENKLKELLTPLTAQTTELSAKVVALNTELENKAKAADAVERARLVKLAADEGKVLPEEAVLKTMSCEQIKAMIPVLAKTVATKSRSKVFSANQQPEQTALERALGRKATPLSANGKSARERTAEMFAENARQVMEQQSFATAN